MVHNILHFWKYPGLSEGKTHAVIDKLSKVLLNGKWKIDSVETEYCFTVEVKSGTYKLFSVSLFLFNGCEIANSVKSLKL